MKKGLIKKVVACALLGIMTMGFVGCGVADNKTTDGNKGEGKDLLNTIQEKGKVVVGMSADYAPYEFHYIDENGKDVNERVINTLIANMSSMFNFDLVEIKKYNVISIITNPNIPKFEIIRIISLYGNCTESANCANSLFGLFTK